MQSPPRRKGGHHLDKANLSERRHKPLHLILTVGLRDQIERVSVVDHRLGLDRDPLLGCVPWGKVFNEALRILREQHDLYGTVRSDVMFLNDGWCDVDQEFIDDYLATMPRLESTSRGGVLATRMKRQPDP